ncbi:helix-turn-helix domain-containing protein [Pseudomonas saxonica]|uniref:Helix-turn-helix domain-containing protein n=1 Tax=Pseudomonas saxonica TaxID=2600598 RepID=A0A5C5Q0N8_9PSED|nr:XRE family transcriptional regulator [Pseudomonas saxonica]TWR96642.1 helix-turn-helix domain-containing protein [Pseudomonas saxonica]
MTIENSEPAPALNPPEPSNSVLAYKLRLLRRNADLTLQQLSQRCGISASALSKIENGQLSPTYEKIAALALGLNVDVGELFSPISKTTPVGRRSVTRRNQGVVHRTDQYSYEMLHTDLADKRFIPMVTTVRAHDRAEFTKLLSHDGEELLFVLSGEVILHTEGYAPLRMGPGDSCYFDSRMGHACVSGTEEDATVLWVSSHAELR